MSDIFSFQTYLDFCCETLVQGMFSVDSKGPEKGPAHLQTSKLDVTDRLITGMFSLDSDGPEKVASAHWRRLQLLWL